MSIQNLAVGQTFPNINTIPKGEGTSLNILKDGSLCIVIRFSKFTSQEKREVKKGVVQFRFIQKEDRIFLLVRFGTLPPMELPFDPTLYKKHGIEFKVLPNLLSIYAVEHATTKLVSVRTIELHQEFLHHLCKIWCDNCIDGILRPTSIFRIQYQLWLDELYGLYTTNELWKMATPIDWKSGRIEKILGNSQKLSFESQYVLNNLPNDPKFQKCLNEAIATGKDIEYASWMESCDNPDEDCSRDYVTLFVSPTGEKKFQRTHTW